MEDGPEAMKRKLRCLLCTKVFEPQIIIDEEKKLLTDTNTSTQMVVPAMLFTEVPAAISIEP